MCGANGASSRTRFSSASETMAGCAVGVELVDQLHESGDGGVEVETFDVLADFADRLVQFPAEPALSRPELGAGQALAPGWVVFRQRARRPAPDAAEEAEGALD